MANSVDPDQTASDLGLHCLHEILGHLPYFTVFTQSTVKPMAQTSLGPWKFVLDMGSLGHWGLFIVPGQEANGNNLGMSFRFSIK